ncbi:MAG: nitronate monooxygenase [Actinomycetota bacterium]|nr:nitronate monooxygenase [Actinomycetota bacterium]
MAVPIVAAPMAGGPSTPALVRAVAEAGGLGFLAAGYKSVEGMRAEIDQVSRGGRSAGACGVNLFVPQPRNSMTAQLEAYIDELQAEAERYGVELPEPNFDDDDAWDAKVESLITAPVPVVSFTFGLPDRAVVEDLHRVGTRVVATVTTPEEAQVAVGVGVDALCVQGPDAGGHRGTHDPYADPDKRPLLDLLRDVRAVTDLPLIAAGGISTAEAVSAVLEAGAGALQLGTALLRTPESGAHPVYKNALADPAFATTAVTRAFSGRWARGLRNRFVDAHSASAPAAYPQVNQLVAPIRRAAAAQVDPHGMALWAGAAYRNVADEPAAVLTERLGRQAKARPA